MMVLDHGLTNIDQWIITEFFHPCDAAAFSKSVLPAEHTQSTFACD